MNKIIKIFSLPWHVSHQFELTKLNKDNGYNIEWYYLMQHTRGWSEQARPFPKHVRWVPYYEPGKYDLAILHVDQQCLLPQLGKSKVFREVRAQIHDIPIIVINHGTPVYPEIFIQMAEKEGLEPTEENGFQWAVNKMKELLEGIDEMVVNSYEARKMWGWGRTIIHGLDPEEWFDLPKEPRIVTMISPAGIGDKYYGRKFFQETRHVLKTKYGIQSIWIGEQGNFAPNWYAYREYIGSSLIYFNPTYGSPMPRSRTEAMMSGCCIVTTPFQDADTFIKDGENGFLVRQNPKEAAKILAELLFDYKRAVKVGQKGKETALKLFNGQRFRQDWIKLINEVLEKWNKKKQ